MKTLQQALGEIIRTVHASTGFEPDLTEGSDALSLYMAVAFQVADLSVRWDASLEEGIKRAIYSSFEFDALKSQHALGTLRFMTPIPATSAILIPAGSRGATPETLEFTTLTDTVIPQGDLFADAPAISVNAGALSNAPAGAVNRLMSSLPGVNAIINPTPFTGGMDAESPEDQHFRFMQFIEALDESSTAGIAAALRALQLPNGDQLSDVLILDHMDDARIPFGSFEVHLYRKGGISPSLLEATTGLIHEVRAAGMIPQVIQTNPTLVNVNIDLLTVTPGIKVFVEQAVQEYFDALTYGEKHSYENLITMMTNANVNVTEITSIQPSADVFCPSNTHILALGSLNVTERLS